MLLLLQLLPLLLLHVEQPELERAGVEAGAPGHPALAWQRPTTCRAQKSRLVLFEIESATCPGAPCRTWCPLWRLDLHTKDCMACISA